MNTDEISTIDCAGFLSTLVAAKNSLSATQPVRTLNKASIDWLIESSHQATTPAAVAGQGSKLGMNPMAALSQFGTGTAGLMPFMCTGFPRVSTAVFGSRAGDSCMPVPLPELTAADLLPALEILASGFQRNSAVMPARIMQEFSTNASLSAVACSSSTSSCHISAPALSTSVDEPSRKRMHALVDGAATLQPADTKCARTVAASSTGFDAAALARAGSSSPVRSHSSRSAASTPVDHLSDASASDDDSGSQSRNAPTIALDGAIAAVIYQQRPRDAGTKYGSMAAAAKLGEVYDVSPKTIRDIWNRKSWVKATRPLWTEREKTEHVPRSHRSREERRAKARRVQ